MFLVLAGVAGCGGAAREAQVKDAEAYYKLGLAFLMEGRPAPALQKLSRAETLTPDDPKVLNALGLAYWARGEAGLAEAKFRKAVGVDPKFADAWNNLGALYLSQERYDKAIPPLEKALSNVFYTTQERALTNLGWALHKVGRTAEGKRKLIDAVEVAPGFPLAHKNLGMLYYDEGDYEAALAELDRAARSVPDDGEVQLYRGLCLLRTGNKDEARKALEKAWRLSPRDEVGRSAKAYLDLLTP